MHKFSDLIPGGLADDKPDSLYDKDQLRKGVKVELEHVDAKDKAKEIAKDHLEEEREAGEVQTYYDKLMKMEGKKHAEDETEESNDPDVPLDASATSARPISMNGEQLDKELDRAKSEQANLQQMTTDPDSQEFVGTPYQADKLDHLDNEIGALNKLMRQVKYNIRDSLTPGQERALQKDAAKKVSPHGFETSFPETNRVTNKGEGNMLASLGLNIGGGPSGRKSDKPVVSTPVFTGAGDITANSTPGAIEYNKAAENTMDVYEKRAAEVLDRKPSLVALNEVKVAFFFEGMADALEKRGYYVESPEAFFVGVYESLRGHFEGPAKLASGVYMPHVVHACDVFTKRMVKAADMSQLQAVNPLDAAGGQDQNSLGVSPARQEKRQDIIDSMLPHAETISLDPDGKIKLKMPSPEAAGVMDPQMMQQQQMNEMQGREQAQAANQTPIPSGEEAPAPMEQGQGGEQGEISPESLQASEQALAGAEGGAPGGEGGMPGGDEGGAPGGGDLPPELAQLMGGAGGGGDSGGLGGENELIQALMAQMQGQGQGAQSMAG